MGGYVGLGVEEGTGGYDRTGQITHTINHPRLANPTVYNFSHSFWVADGIRNGFYLSYRWNPSLILPLSSPIPQPLGGGKGGSEDECKEEGTDLTHHLIPLVSEKLRQDGPTVGIFNGNLLMIQTLGSLVVGEGREGEEGV